MLCALFHTSSPTPFKLHISPSNCNHISAVPHALMYNAGCHLLKNEHTDLASQKNKQEI